MSTLKNTIVITGATGAVGSKIAKECLAKQFNLVLIVRDKNKALNIFGTQNVNYVEADLMDLKSMEKAANKINLSYEVNTIINCAGASSLERILLANNLEKTFVINYLSIYLLNKLLCEHQVNKHLSKIFTVTISDDSPTAANRGRWDLVDLVRGHQLVGGRLSLRDRPL